jgi:hypothetical protein
MFFETINPSNKFDPDGLSALVHEARVGVAAVLLAAQLNPLIALVGQVDDEGMQHPIGTVIALDRVRASSLG